MAWRLVGTCSAVGVLLGGCLSSVPPEIITHTSAQGEVYLEEPAGRRLQATHPSSLQPIIIVRVLNGVRVREKKTLLGTLLSTKTTEAQPFSQEETAFLAPLVAAALSRATPEQRVGFRVFRKTAVGRETTAGTLYAYGHSLHVTLTKYRHNPKRPDPLSMPERRTPDPTGLMHRTVLFVPEAALRAGMFRDPGPVDHPNLTTLVIDSRVLESPEYAEQKPLSPSPPLAETSPESDEPRSAAAPITPDSVKTPHRGSSSAETRRARGDQVDTRELDALRQELRSLQRRVAEQEEHIQRLEQQRRPEPHSP